MPITKNVFIKGKMNKDLDERIVPNGEYRDALNVQISTSDGSDIGVMQNVLGNKLAYDSAINIAGGKCIGSVADTENNKIYWFIAGNSVDAIAEYDESTRLVSPVLVSVKTSTVNVLKFDKSKLITGVNIIDGLLFFTDNNSEPKKISIEDCKEGSEDFSTHTKFTKYDGTEYNFEEKDITVIKCGPTEAPVLTVANTNRFERDGSPSTVTATSNISFSYGGELRSSTNVPNFIALLYAKPNFKKNDKIKIYLSEEESDEEIGVEITAVCRFAPTTGYNYGFRIDSISENTPLASRNYVFELIQEDPLFEKEFARFAYRYKYKDGEYSPISPFTQPAFIPKNFEYDSAKGYNEGMSNNLRYLKISNFINSYIPSQVSELEILFKKDSSTNIYSVKSFEYSDQEWKENFYEIESELIHKVLPANQLLRPYDNVPKKAKAQEIVANRLIYGNYLQNFNLINNLNKNISLDFTCSANSARFQPESGNNYGKSIKSMRTYQLGVTYLDQYGRETPIQTDDSGVLRLNKDYSNKYSGIEAAIESDPPTFATNFKYYIKETSNQYYNLAMDRWYDAEDGNIWVSFPSSERNKVDEETFIILKKAHNSNELITDPSKYKIIDIKNEAPQEIKRVYNSYGSIQSPSQQNQANLFTSDNYPREDATFIEVREADFNNAFGNNSNLKLDSDRYLRIFHPALGRSRYYKISSIGNPLSNSAYYTIRLADRFGAEVNQYFPEGNDDTDNDGRQVGVEFFQSVIEDKKEFIGRFFAKISRDSVINENIINIFQVEEYSIINTKKILNRFNKGGRTHDNYKENGWGWRNVIDGEPVRFFVDNHSGKYWRGDTKGSKTSLFPDSNSYYSWWYTDPIQSGRNQIAFEFVGQRSVSAIKTEDNGAHSDFITAMTTIGSKFRFSEDPDQNVYTIKNYAFRGMQKSENYKDGRANKQTQFVFELDKRIQNFNVNGRGTSSSNIDEGKHFTIEILEEYTEGLQFKSPNPAIFETEPKEAVDIDIYYEASNALPIEQHGNTQQLDWFNCFSFGNGVESNRIRDDFNAPIIAKGVKVSAPLAEQYKEERRKNGLIFSGIFNSTSGINRLNQFIAAENITKDLNPEYGSIQKLHTRDTDLIAFCEDKVLKVLAQKDALFNADGNANVTSNAAVLGQAIPFVGEFGISKNPESFASYGYRMYFADKSRGMVMRLSRNGLESISAKGMQSYFYDKLNLSNRIIGTFDVRKGNYNLTLIEESAVGEILESLDTVSYKEEAQGWPSRKSYIPESGLSLNSIYYTFKNGELYSHNNETRNTFYGEAAAKSSVKLILNSNPSEIKNYKTVNYEGDTGWICSSIITDQQNGDVPTFIEEEGKYYNFIKGIENSWDDIAQTGGLDTKEFSTQGIDTLQSIEDAVGQSEVTITIKENND